MHRESGNNKQTKGNFAGDSEQQSEKLPEFGDVLQAYRIIEKSPKKFVLECFPPTGITVLLKRHFIWWLQPPVLTCCCCCCCDKPVPQVPQPQPLPQPQPAPQPAPITTTLGLQPNTFGSGRAIHIVAVPAIGGNPPQYVAEWFMRWNASGGVGQLTVELQVQRPGSSTFQTLVTGRGPSDSYLFSTNRSGDYLFKAIARDSSGNFMFATSSVTAPMIPGIGL